MKRNHTLLLATLAALSLCCIPAARANETAPPAEIPVPAPPSPAAPAPDAPAAPDPTPPANPPAAEKPKRARKKKGEDGTGETAKTEAEEDPPLDAAAALENVRLLIRQLDRLGDAGVIQAANARFHLANTLPWLQALEGNGQ